MVLIGLLASVFCRWMIWWGRLFDWVLLVDWLVLWDFGLDRGCDLLLDSFIGVLA